MARIRSIKPEFWTSEQVMECSPTARLLFVGLWNFCDDGGSHPASAKTLKAEVFPGDDISASDVQGLIQELIEQGLLREYEVSEKPYWCVTGWHHQKIDKPTFKYPRPPEFRQPFAEQSGNVSLSARRDVEESSPPERNGCRRERTTTAPTDSSNRSAPKQSVKPEKPKPEPIVFDGQGFVGLDPYLPGWHQAYPAIELDTEIAKAAAWLVANPKNRKSNLARFLTSWLTRAQDRAPPRGGSPAGGRDWT